ncbi:DUF305 domain-containing protein [Mesorhizobium sp. M7A.F.Ca.US.008.03.1.1]|uniref:CopM family metallochaperone n=1 Tax=Mesorhizobium sp. M7A.F.Ca.US.008.03.1.1 TaxID=2496742 RepID=UPI000FCC2400|nr:DUF305 domain-containing protein [Mesorhizobium sp. M7A.F.Ca.US.008.03.1.1]RUW60699.1 DUF305 domain-containing protein [Mesorhizobium sp. M7A.F.Ca.US.008.03.1.1]
MHTIKFAAAFAFALTGANFWGFGASAAEHTSSLPEKCRQAEAKPMAGMTDMSKTDMSGMDEAHQAYMQSMMKMNPDMMQGMMASDADVAFVCGMIAHHQGAIDMANVELKYGDDKKAKQMAKKVIAAQKEEIAKFTKWVEAEAK